MLFKCKTTRSTLPAGINHALRGAPLNAWLIFCMYILYCTFVNQYKGRGLENGFRERERERGLEKVTQEIREEGYIGRTRVYIP